MSKSIKVSEHTYNDLRYLEQKGDTFDNIIHRLIQLAYLFEKVEPLLKGQHDVYTENLRRADAEKAAHG